MNETSLVHDSVAHLVLVDCIVLQNHELVDNLALQVSEAFEMVYSHPILCTMYKTTTLDVDTAILSVVYILSVCKHHTLNGNDNYSSQ